MCGAPDRRRRTTQAVRLQRLESVVLLLGVFAYLVGLGLLVLGSELLSATSPSGRRPDGTTAAARGSPQV
jgi:hypothetical protein